MAYVKNLQVAYHQQDTDYYCGAACAQMVLDSPSVGAGLLDQAALYTDNHNHSLDESGLTPAVYWATAPDGLTWTLNDRRPAGFSGIFVEFALTTEDAISRKIAWTIEHYGVTPCALVYGVKHWIVVRGIDVSKAPAAYDDTSYTINGFRVNNPWPPVPSATYWQQPGGPPPPPPPPPPHGGTDGCGVGTNRGNPNEYISYSGWKSIYMPGTYGSYPPQGHWYGKYTAVCDPDPPVTRRGPQAVRERRFDGRRVISREEASQVAHDLLERKSVPIGGLWEEDALRDVHPAEPILVQHLNRVDDYYYVVPLTRPRRAASSALVLDAKYGDILQASVFAEPTPLLTTLPTNDSILNRIGEHRIEAGHTMQDFVIRKETATVSRIWCWKPCRESFSPLWPFRIVMSGRRFVYVRIDGAVFTALHDNVYGI